MPPSLAGWRTSEARAGEEARTVPPTVRVCVRIQAIDAMARPAQAEIRARQPENSALDPAPPGAGDCGLLLAGLGGRAHRRHLLSAADLRVRIARGTRAGFLVHEHRAASLADVPIAGVSGHGSLPRTPTESGSPARRRRHARSQPEGFARRDRARSVALPSVFDFSRCSRLLDVGGGTGSWSMAVARACPQLEITVSESLPAMRGRARCRQATMPSCWPTSFTATRQTRIGRCCRR